MFSSILMGWWNLLMPSHGVLMIPFPYLNIDIDQLAFELGANTFWARYKDHIIFEFFYY
jgi:hypothetical protein